MVFFGPQRTGREGALEGGRTPGRRRIGLELDRQKRSAITATDKCSVPAQMILWRGRGGWDGIYIHHPKLQIKTKTKIKMHHQSLRLSFVSLLSLCTLFDSASALQVEAFPHTAKRIAVIGMCDRQTTFSFYCSVNNTYFNHFRCLFTTHFMDLFTLLLPTDDVARISLSTLQVVRPLAQIFHLRMLALKLPKARILNWLENNSITAIHMFILRFG